MRVKIGTELKALRQRAGMSQRAFGAALGVAWRSIQDYEAGRMGMDSRKAASLLVDAKKLARRRRRTENGK